MDALEMSGWAIFIAVAVLWFGGILLYVWLGRSKDLTPDQVKLMGWAKVLVASAEQLFDTNEEKIKYVTDELLKQAADMQTAFTEKEIRAFIEWAVYWVKRVAVPSTHGPDENE